LIERRARLDAGSFDSPRSAVRRSRRHRLLAGREQGLPQPSTWLARDFERAGETVLRVVPYLRSGGALRLRNR
jgi:hypothetical protein